MADLRRFNPRKTSWKIKPYSRGSCKLVVLFKSLSTRGILRSKYGEREREREKGGEVGPDGDVNNLSRRVPRSSWKKRDVGGKAKNMLRP